MPHSQSEVRKRTFPTITCERRTIVVRETQEHRFCAVAIKWEGNDPAAESQSWTYKQLRGLVCQIANYLKAKGVKKGDCGACLLAPKQTAFAKRTAFHEWTRCRACSGRSCAP